MPVFRNSSVVSLARGFKAFFNVEAGVSRASTPDFGRNGKDPGVRPENMVWIFSYGSGRSGTTWLSNMLRDLENCSLWQSPRVGSLFGEFYYDHVSSKRGQTRRDHILGADRETWVPPMRDFILASADARHPDLARPEAKGHYLAISEHHGSLGAPLIMEALPESRMVLMMRDPRDVAASVLDSGRSGSWAYETQKKFGVGQEEAGIDPIGRVTRHANGNLKSMSRSLEAYENHTGPKAILKYEDLRADGLGEMKRLVASLGMKVDEAELARVVEENSWENVPEDQKGKGKFYRKASPGGWKDDLSAEEARIVEETLAPVIERFYPHREGEK